MTSTSMPHQFGEPAEPSAPPAGDHSSESVLADPVAIRQAHLREEAYLKALGKVHLLYAVLFGVLTWYLARFTVLHLMGRINAPWSVRPDWFGLQVTMTITALIALAAAIGYLRLRRWALRLEVVFLLGVAIYVALSVMCQSRIPDLGELAGMALLHAAVLVPLINLWDVRNSEVLDPSYRDVIRSSPGVRVRARLTWELKLPMLVLGVAGLLFAVYSVKL